jgi:mono/diheme cytochrome c family protein
MAIRKSMTPPVSAVQAPGASATAARPWHFLCLPLLVTACQNLSSAEPAPATPPRGQAFAQASCSGCHAVGLYGTSPNPNAPPFGAIANQEGLTADTLSYWLRGAHNYPREMDFALGERDVDTLVSYMLSLRDPNYRRPPD